MDDEHYFAFPWMSGGEFESLAELELAYGDNCVDGAISDTAELWATRSQTLSPCVGSWTPSEFSLDDAIRRWSAGGRRRPDADGLYITGFRQWLEHQLSGSAEFGDFVWDRFTEFAFESMMNLKRNIKLACDDDIKLNSGMMYKFRDRINTLPYFVRIAVPPMPDDTEARLAKAAEEALRPRRKARTLRIPLSAFAKQKGTTTASVPQSISNPKAAGASQKQVDRHVNAEGASKIADEDDGKRPTPQAPQAGMDKKGALE